MLRFIWTLTPLLTLSLLFAAFGPLTVDNGRQTASQTVDDGRWKVYGGRAPIPTTTPTPNPGWVKLENTPVVLESK